MVLVQQAAKLAVQHLMLLYAVCEAALEVAVADMAQNAADGGHAHFDSRIALPQQLNGIRFNHIVHLLFWLIPVYGNFQNCRHHAAVYGGSSPYRQHLRILL